MFLAFSMFKPYAFTVFIFPCMFGPCAFIFLAFSRLSVRTPPAAFLATGRDSTFSLFYDNRKIVCKLKAKLFFNSVTLL